MIDTTVGNYRIVERIGDGGMGAVYRAVDEMLDRVVAIKVLKPELARNAALIERFRQEAIALARLNHSRIATLHGLERHGESFLMIMEYVRGDTLEAVVQRSGRIAWSRAAELCAATLDALDHAHDKGVIHRDIKPANIMLATNGAVKVMDFGIARLIGRTRQTQLGHALGTPMYMAPEQLRGEEVDGRTDLYATGAVLFELVTGRMAFEADSDYALMMMQLNDPPPSARALVADVPPALDDIIARAMAKRREDRFQNAGAFRDALERIIGWHRVSHRPAVPGETRLAPPVAEAPNAHVSAGGPLAPKPLPATRLATPSDRDHDAVPATRLVTPRLATAWMRDWRPYAVAGVVFASAALVVRTVRPDVTDHDSGNVVTADTTTVVTTRVAAGTTARPASAPPAPPRETANDLLINPPASQPGASGDGGTAKTPVVVDRKPPNAGSAKGRAYRPVGDHPSAGAAAPSAPPVQQDSATPPNAQHESDAEADSRIRDALRVAASSLSGRNSVAGSLLAGGIQDQWVSLMKEGRIAVSVDGSPQIVRRGSSASAEFDASVNVRSPFGANRRQRARFTAELRQNGDAWRVVSLMPVGGLQLK